MSGLFKHASSHVSLYLQCLQHGGKFILLGKFGHTPYSKQTGVLRSVSISSIFIVSESFFVISLVIA